MLAPSVGTYYSQRLQRRLKIKLNGGFVRTADLFLPIQLTHLHSLKAYTTEGVKAEGHQREMIDEL